MKIGKRQLLKAIAEMDGNYLAIARRFEMTRQAVYKRINSDPELIAAREEARQAVLDLAEEKLVAKVRRGTGASWAIKLILETLGKDRGYTKSMSFNAQVTGVTQSVKIYIPDNGRQQGIDAPLPRLIEQQQ